MSDNTINEGLKKVLYTGIGLAAVSVDLIGKTVELLAAKGEEAVEKGKVMNEELKRKRAAAKANVKEIAAQLDQMSKEEIEAVRARLADIEIKLEEVGKGVKTNVESIVSQLEEMSREEFSAIKAKLEEMRKNWTDDGDEGAEG